MARPQVNASTPRNQINRIQCGGRVWLMLLQNLVVSQLTWVIPTPVRKDDRVRSEVR